MTLREVEVIPDGVVLDFWRESPGEAEQPDDSEVEEEGRVHPVTPAGRGGASAHAAPRPPYRGERHAADKDHDEARGPQELHRRKRERHQR
jgi:hypothetical protein